jgi:hypothetical protein
MDNDIKRFLLIYVVPICVLSLVMVFIAPPMFSVGILAMITSVSLLVISIAFLIDYFDK